MSLIDCNSKTQICDLCQHKQFIPMLAEWHLNQWKHSAPDRVVLIGSRAGEFGVPKTFVAMVGK